jgi:deoxyribose-phosphate aldolase
MHLFKCPQDDGMIRNLIAHMDYSNALVTNVTEEVMKKTCEEAVEYGFVAVAVMPTSVEYMVEQLRGTPVKVLCAVGFPTGNHHTEIKVAETRLALMQGAREIDMVMSIKKFVEKDYDYVQSEIHQIVELAASFQTNVKVIIETFFLDDEQKLLAAELAVNAGAEYVKVATGVNPGRATVHDIALLYDKFQNRVKIKASGGCPSLEDGQVFYETGASRITARRPIIDQLDMIGYRP